MRVDKEHFFISKGKFGKSEELQQITEELNEAINLVTWHSENEFVINPKRKGNGVKPIKERFIEHLVSLGWKAEERMSFAYGMNPGPVDVMKDTSYGLFAVEWETGNISSSHRALNKIAVGILQEAIIGGILILPIRKLAMYLTDRIGNYEEIEPYFPVYENLFVEEGVIGVIGVEQDSNSEEVPLIPKGNDGYSIARRNLEKNY